MADSKDETGKGAGRPYATIDVKATEVGTGAGTSGYRAKTDGRLGSRNWRVLFASAFARLRGWKISAPAVSHLAAGLLGGIIVLLVALLAYRPGASPSPSTPQVQALTARLAELENALAGRSGDPGLRNRLESLTRATGALDDATARLSTQVKAIEERIGSAAAATPEFADRVAKLENAITALSAAGGGDGAEAMRTGIARFEREVASVKADADKLAQRLSRTEQSLRTTEGTVESIKSEFDRNFKGVAKSADLAPLSERVAALDRKVQSFIESESDRTANTSRVVLSLELSNLKRAIERGDSFIAELAAVRKVAGDKIDLTVFDRYAKEGLPSASDLTQSFGKVANAMLDTESEPANASLFERMMAGAKSIVRIRKSEHATDDRSLEATLSRMEAALKENRLGEVLAQGRKLPPKAALAAEDWLKRVEIRHQVEQALADTESALKKSLASTGPAGAGGKQ